jgi:osmoprotectant transport system permease protein
MLQRAFQYALDHQEELLKALNQHLLLVAIALGVGIVICLPLGLWTSRNRQAGEPVIGVFSSLRVIPSLAILFLAIPYFGLSTTSAAIALTVLALPPILINADAAFRTIDPAVVESAYAMGMTPRQALMRVEIPLAVPVALTGIRTAAVEVIASATLAAFIGSGGLGIYITRGFALYDTAILLTGAVPVALLTLVVEGVLGGMQRVLQPPAA